MVGVEDGAQRLHVVLRRRIPVGEDDLVVLGNMAGAVEIEHQHAVARRRPGGAVLPAVARHVVIGVRRRQRIDLDPVAVEIEDDGMIVARAHAAGVGPARFAAKAFAAPAVVPFAGIVVAIIAAAAAFVAILATAGIAARLAARIIAAEQAAEQAAERFAKIAQNAAQTADADGSVVVIVDGRPVAIRAGG